MNMQRHISKILLFNISKSVFVFLTCASLFSCGGNGGDGAPFKVSGTVANTSAKGAASYEALAVLPSTANYVYAVNTRLRYLTMDRKKAPINADGTFSISLTKSDPWILAFIDTSKVGEAMIQGIFYADQLDAIAPKKSTASNSTDVGNVVVDGIGGAGLPVENYVTYIGDLGLNMTEASVLGALDEGALRYINPDLDGNGILDMDDPAFPNLKVQWRQEYRYGDTALLDNLRNGIPLPLNDVFSLGLFGSMGTQINLKIQQQGSGIFSDLPGRFSLEMENVGDYVGDNPAFWTPSSASSGLFSEIDTEWSNELNYYVSFSIDVHKVPDGKYTFRFYSDEAGMNLEKTLTFSNVASMADATDVSNFVIPFPVYNANQSGDITSVSYTWMKYEAGAFINATASDIEIMVGNQDASIGWYSSGCGQIDCRGGGIEWRPSNNGFSPTGTISEIWWASDASRKRADIQRMSAGYVSNPAIWINMNIWGD